MEHASRKIVTRSPTRTVYILNLHGILPEPVECESNLERDFVLRASLHPLVSRITHQPFRLDLGNGHKYTPDFLISLAGTPCWVVEVKIKRKVSAYTETFRLAATQLRAHELGFLVATECEIQADRIHERAAHLLRYLKATCDKDECERVMRCAAEYPRGIPLSALTGLASVSPSVIYHLLGRRLLSTGDRLSIGDDALVTTTKPIEEIDHEDHFAAWLDLAPWRAND